MRLLDLADLVFLILDLLFFPDFLRALLEVIFSFLSSLSILYFQWDQFPIRKIACQIVSRLHQRIKSSLYNSGTPYAKNVKKATGLFYNFHLIY